MQVSTSTPIYAVTTSLAAPPTQPKSVESTPPGMVSPTPSPPNINPIRTHNMTTFSMNDIHHPKQLNTATKHPMSPPVESTCATQALKDPNWRQAMSDEFTALVRHGTWSLVPPDPSQNLVGNKWVFRVKRNSDGRIAWYKAQLMTKGFHQHPGLDYGQTFSLVVKPTTIRLVISLALQHSWPLFQLDVNNVFLHDQLDENVYMQQPVGFKDSNHPNHVCKLLK